MREMQLYIRAFSASRRLSGPAAGKNGSQQSKDWPGIIRDIGNSIEDITKKHGPESIGILLNPDLTNEETEKALTLSALIGTPHIDCCALEDKPILARSSVDGLDVRETEGVGEIEKCETSLIIGDLFAVSPVLSKRFLKAKYEQRSNKLIVLESSNSHTSWFADVKLRAGPERNCLSLSGYAK